MDRVKVAVTVVSLTALALILRSEYRRLRRRRGRKLRKSPRSSCYLHSDQKPQVSFKRVLADNSYSQFKHFKNPISGNSSNSHPYESEINALLENPRLLDIDYGDRRDLGMGDSYVWVETESQLNDLAVALSRERLFAVDTEQHSLRSFLGFTALVQISTKMQDYLVDTIALHDVMSVLRPVFADPNICKVFHGADNDVLWLQRDFQLYVVNLFDTAKACEVLSKPYKSLAYLLETYCGVATNKLLQREDWRQRPLSSEMLEYARTDAHYLLHIAGCLISELKQSSSDNTLENKINFLIEASRRSNMTCLQLYSKETEAPPGESAASSIFSRHFYGQRSLSISCETQDLVRRLCAWRDLMVSVESSLAVSENGNDKRELLPLFLTRLEKISTHARVHDESLRFVLSDQSIVLLATEVPKSQTELYNTISQANLNGDLANSSGSPPSPSPVVCCHLDYLYIFIQEKDVGFESAFQALLEKCLGPNGGCPLSIYNYALLLNRDLQPTGRTKSKQNGFRHPKNLAKKASRELFVQKFSCKTPVYHNFRIFASDGRLLCYCDRRKLEWYLHRDLAKLVDDDPPAIMLLFEPKGRPEDEGNDFYIQSKKNICVSCGEGSHYLRYRVIPSCYRMHFPEHLKSHRSHDIVLLCVDCHEVAHAAAEKHKKQIAAEFGIPLFVRKVVDSEERPEINWHDAPTMQADEVGVSPLHLRTAAMALLRHGQRMPADRQRELTQIIKQYYGGRELTEEDLENALLVGMSPQERRKFEKKRRSSFKHSADRHLPDKKQIDIVISEAKSALDCAAKIDASGESQNLSRTEPTCIEENNGDGEESPTKDVDSEAAEDNSAESSSETTLSLQSLGNVGKASKDKLKSSLLGHGPHGKQVVDHILEQHGEGGVAEFCQRWRKVFVESTQPRFLPAGWDVMHRRDFGEYSVYNPAKKEHAA